jgi:hypothetical protein
MPTATTPRRPRPRARSVPTVASRQFRVAATLVLLAATIALAGCADAEMSPAAQPDGLLALAGDGDGTALTGWGKSGGGTDIELPAGTTTWISAGRAGVLVATLAAGTTATSSPLHLDKTPKWRPVSAKDPAGKKPSGPASFATWDPQGGRYATLAGDLLSSDPIGLVLVDPSTASAFEIALDRAVVAAPPAWIGSDRLVVVTGDAGAPRTTIVDTSTSELSDGPAGARLIATSANGRRTATMAKQGAPVLVRDTAGWLDGDGSSIASIEPPSDSTTAIAFALDSTGQRLAIAWAAADGSVSLAVHDATSDWRRVAQPKIAGKPRGAVVAWLR